MYGHWVGANQCSIHFLLKNCEAVFTVNSGTGMEALLYDKPVYTFGEVDYEAVSHHVEPEAIEAAWEQPRYSPEIIKSFLETYARFCYDTTAEPCPEQGFLPISTTSNPILIGSK